MKNCCQCEDCRNARLRMYRSYVYQPYEVHWGKPLGLLDWVLVSVFLTGVWTIGSLIVDVVGRYL